MSLGSLSINLNLETVQFQNALNKSNQQTLKFAKQFEVNLSKAQTKARQFSERTTQYLSNIEKAANNINSTTKWGFRFENLGRIQEFARQTIAMMDGYTELQNRMRLVTNSQLEMAAATETVFDIALRTNQSLGSTSEVYQRFAKNAQRLGISQSDVAELTETVAKTVAMSGASAASAQASLMQFGQAMAAGQLRGEELNSVMEQTPALAQAIADGLGVSVGALRDMGKNGKLEISKIIDALKKVKTSIDKDFEKRVKTVSMAFTTLETSMTKFVGEVDNSYGVTQKLADTIELVANNLGTLITVASTFGGALAIGQVSKYSYELLKTGVNSAKNVIAHTREAQAILAKATAIRTAAQAEMATLNAQYQLAQSEKTRAAIREQMKVQAAQIITLNNAEAAAKRNLATATNLAATAARGLRSVMALLGGPAGAAMIAATALMYFSNKAHDARQWALDTANANQLLAESYDQLSEAALSLKITEQLDNIKKYYAEIEKIKAGIATKQIGTDFEGFQVGGEIDEQELEKLNNQIQTVQENAAKAEDALEKMLSPLGEKMLRSGKTLDDVRQKFKLLGADADVAERIIANLPTSFDNTANSTNTATVAALDFDKAIKQLKERSQTMQQRLEVLTLKNKGHAKASFILAGLYDTLGAAGSEYSKVLNAIANGDVDAAQSAAQAINLSAQQLQTMLDMGKQLDAMFATEQQTQTFEKTGSSRQESSRDSFLSFYDELAKKSQSTYQEIEAEERRTLKRLADYAKSGVATQQEVEQAKLQIAKKFQQQRQELADKYSPEKAATHALEKELEVIRQLQNAGILNIQEAQRAAQSAEIQFAEQRSQSAVDPVAQIRGRYDKNQNLENQQTQELAFLQSIYEQKLIKEEEFQQRKSQIIADYQNRQRQTELDYYSQSTSIMNSAFGEMANIMAGYVGKQSTSYKAMFAVSKAFAIAEASVKLSQAIAQAMADPTALTPVQKFANMASVAAAGVNVLSQITSVAFAKGGHVQGPGTGTSDSILARLSNNEFVMTSRSVDHYGVGFLNALNQRRLPKFAGGGHVGGKSGSYDGLFNSSNNTQSNEVSITINIDSNGNENITAEQKAAQGKELAMAIQANVLEVLKKQRRPGGLLA
ncbi:phage tape measure protein [Actinobacillus seminis]|uniref:Phage tape measure protein n=1 Tax=Actinobacillus seminis TaxID=722 RepID=A0A380VDK5_9PAST|nr:tape measure protein [Actinobacillus seminis]SUU36041.1 phage tape measure protein [Actinobacillus seminis]